MYLFEISIMNLDTDIEIAQAAMIGDMVDLHDKESVLDILERLGNLIVEFNSDKKGQVE